MSTGWTLSEKMMPAVKAALGDIPNKHFNIEMATAPIERDMKEATDLVMHLSGGDLAIRVRANRYIQRPGPLGFDWSVRWWNKGVKTEIDKLREGYAWRYFTGVANKIEDGLVLSCLIDMDAVRRSGILDDENQWLIWPNGDGTSGAYIHCETLNLLGCILWPVVPVPIALPVYEPELATESKDTRRSATPDGNTVITQLKMW